MSKNHSQKGSVQEPSKRKLIKRLRVIVTQKEIDEAMREKSNKCMIHEAIKRDHPGFQRILVDKNHVRFTDPKQNVIYTFQMAPTGRAAILMWDDGGLIRPFDAFLYNPIVRERRFRQGRMTTKSNERTTKKHLGPVPNPKTKEARMQSGRDRVYGKKLWTAELVKLRGIVEDFKPPKSTQKTSQGETRKAS